MVTSRDTENITETDVPISPIVVIDVEGSGGRLNPAKRAVRANLIAAARDGAGAADVPWEVLGFNDTGDGMLLVFPSDTRPALIAGPMIKALCAQLDTVNERVGDDARAAAQRLRLRVSIHLGLVHRDAQGYFGEAVDFAFRLIDAKPVRAALVAADHSDLALIVSDEFYTAVVQHAYRSIDPAAYRHIVFDTKDRSGLPAWVYVPGYPSPPGLAASVPEPELAPTAPESSTSQQPAAGGVSIGSIGTVRGDVVNTKNVYPQGQAGY